MQLPDNIYGILSEFNPFTSSSVGDPWVSRYPDVPSINRQAYDGIYNLFKQKDKNPAINCACLILGEVGSGKTHLISRMLELSRKTDFSFTFAYIQPIEDSHSTFIYLLREAIINLCHPLERTVGCSWDSQLYRLITNILKEINPDYKPVNLSGNQQNFSRGSMFQRLQHRILDISGFQSANEPIKNLIKLHKKATNLLRRTYPEINKRFLDVLFQYTIPDKQAIALEWLKGNILDDEEAAILQMTDRSNLPVSALEHEARDILISLGILLGRYNMPMLVCFDRLENLETDAQLHALGKMIEFLVDKVQAMLPVVCFRGQQWEERFRHRLNQHVVSRLETNTYELEACTADQAIGIIESRLASVLNDKVSGLYPFDRKELHDIFKDHLYSPRTVINIANEKLREILKKGVDKVIPPIERIQELYEKEKQNILKDMDLCPPDRTRLRKALELYMSYRPTGNIKSVQQQNDETNQLDLIVKIQSSENVSYPVIFIIDPEQHHMSVKAKIQRGITCLAEHSPVKVLYIRDARCPFPPPPKWKETNNLLQRFIKLGGEVFFLGYENAAAWYALALLSYAAKEGDLTIVDQLNNHSRPILWDEFVEFIKLKINGVTCPAFQGIDEALSIPPEQNSFVSMFAQKK